MLIEIMFTVVDVDMNYEIKIDYKKGGNGTKSSMQQKSEHLHFQLIIGTFLTRGVRCSVHNNVVTSSTWTKELLLLRANNLLF
jgi:hypothetical protein